MLVFIVFSSCPVGFSFLFLLSLFAHDTCKYAARESDGRQMTKLGNNWCAFLKNCGFGGQNSDDCQWQEYCQIRVRSAWKRSRWLLFSGERAEAPGNQMKQAVSPMGSRAD